MIKERVKHINTIKKVCLVGIFSGSVLLAGCNTPAIFYEDWYNPPVHWGHHTVREGETLYKIAWRYGRDYRELGNANGLSHPYTIKEGQTIRLDLEGVIPESARSISRTSSQGSSSGVTVYADDPKTHKTVAVTNSSPSNKQKTINIPDVANNIEWAWPHNGDILKGFSNKGMRVKGIDIKGSMGDDVQAAANGHVVYSGSGILGYGKMIILGHDSKTFTVYAHNNELLVSEGDAVSKGQNISKMGDSGADQVKLYFELRKNGQSIDPLTVLPKKQK